MLRNYMKIAWRNIIRNKTFSAINILGLALGIASSLLLVLWVWDEWHMGKQYPNMPQLFRVMENEIADGRVVTDDDTPGILAGELKRVIPEITYAAGISGIESHVMNVADKVSRMAGAFAGADWFKIYNLPLLAGTRESALDDPNDISISRKMAEMFFGNAQSAIGQTIRLDSHQDFKVAAVFENLPQQSIDQYDYLLNWNLYLKREPWLNVWENAGPNTRVLLQPGADAEKVNAKLKTFLKARNKDINASYNIELFLQPEGDVYLYDHFKNGHIDGGRIEYVRLFIIVAIFILLIAGINFMNLATARSVTRAKEIGVRKAAGAARISLIWQFMNEAGLMTLIATLIAVAAVMFTLPYFNLLTGKHLFIPFADPVCWSLLIGIVILTTALSGSYPALFLSSINPVKVLKGALKMGTGAQFFRKGLVVFQFVLSVLMMIGTIVVYQQLQYIQKRNLGFDRENLIELRGEGTIAQKFETFKQELLQKDGIKSITFMQTSPLYNGNTSDNVVWTGKDPNVAIQFNNTSVGFDFVKTMELTLVSGRDYSPQYSDSSNFLINESAAARMGYKDPVGQPLAYGSQKGTIIGVVKDFNFNSLHVPIRPLIIHLHDWEVYGHIMIRTAPGKTKEALASIEAVHAKMNPEFPFTYSFVDKDFETMYKSEAVVGRLITLFAGLSIFIACLGLFGLATFTAEQRIKEIGIRKVLGASVTSIVTLLSGDFMKLVALAIVIACPLAWYAMEQWLQTFSYKISLSWIEFLSAGVAAIFIALLTISFQSIKAALVNPIRSLKSE